MKPDIIRLYHIRDSILEIEEFCKDGRSKFENSVLIKRACQKCLEIIGEAAASVSEDLKKKNVEIPWQRMKDFRNHLIHQYDDIDYRIVWNVIEEKLPLIKA